jgi:hypothetical protein
MGYCVEQSVRRDQYGADWYIVTVNSGVGRQEAR